MWTELEARLASMATQNVVVHQAAAPVKAVQRKVVVQQKVQQKVQQAPATQIFGGWSEAKTTKVSLSLSLSLSRARALALLPLSPSLSLTMHVDAGGNLVHHSAAHARNARHGRGAQGITIGTCTP